MKPGKHAYSGSCSPGASGSYTGQVTFSVGIFQWEPKANWDCCKKSAVKVRVKGYMSQMDAVYAKAGEIVSQLDDGVYSGPKNITIKPS